MTDLSCADARRLATQLLDGDLSPSQIADVHAHVATCQTCPALYRSVVAVHGQLIRMREQLDEVPARLRHEIAQLLER